MDFALNDDKRNGIMKVSALANTIDRNYIIIIIQVTIRPRYRENIDLVQQQPIYIRRRTENIFENWKLIQEFPKVVIIIFNISVNHYVR